MRKIIGSILCGVLIVGGLTKQADAYGYNKKKGQVSFYSTNIIRGAKDVGGLRTDNAFKWGVTDWFTMYSETSIITGGGQGGFFGLNYQSFIGTIQIYQNDVIGLNIGFGIRTPTLSGPRARGDWIGSGDKLKELVQIGLDVRINKYHTLGFQLLYRSNDGYSGAYHDIYRFNIDWFWTINDKWSMRTFWWETLHSATLIKSSGLAEIMLYYKPLDKLKVGLGLSYYYRHDQKYNWHNTSIVICLDYTIK